jgi:Heterokaryon incompatibility protein (HET)
MNSAPNPPYGLYEPLLKDPATIRLLTLLGGASSDPLQCRLDNVPLEPEPEFEALSYSWGDLTVTRPIQVNDGTLHVTCNLEAALKHLRPTDGDRTLWVDALCINQADVVERGYQVSIMGQIYGKAKQVLVWLGEELNIPQNALRPFSFLRRNPQINQLKAEVQQYLPSGSGDLRLNNLYLDEDSRDAGKVEPVPQGDTLLLAFTVLYMLSQDMHIQALVQEGTRAENSFRLTVLNTLLSIFSQAWWNRMWVVQEVVLAREVIVMYGHISGPWEMFARAGLGIERHRNSCCLETRTQIQELSDILTRISNEILEIEQSQLLRRGDDEVADFFRKYSTDGVAPRGGIIRKRTTKLGAYIWHTRHREALDPRDKIYGVLGLVPDWIDTTPIIPDYSVSSYHAFRDAVLKLIRGQQNFDILVEAQSNWATHPDLHAFIKCHDSPIKKTLQNMVAHSRVYGPYLPSWVPDFTAPAPYHQADRQAKLLLVNAMSITEVPIELHDNFVLSTMSLAIDVVIDTGPILFVPPGHDSEAKGTLTETLSSRHVFKDWSSAAKTFKNFMPNIYPLGGGSFEHAFMRTVCAGLKWWRHPPGNRRPIFILEMGMGDGFYNELEEEDFASFKMWEDWVLDHQKLSLHEFCQLKGASVDSIRGLNKAIISACLGRRFFVTPKGYMGMGPPGMRGGDIVHVPFGSKTPFVLRRAGEALLSDKGPQRCHTLVGDCYVQGIMRGEIQEAYTRVQKALEAGQTVDGSEIRRFDLTTVFLQ